MRSHNLLQPKLKPLIIMVMDFLFKIPRAEFVGFAKYYGANIRTNQVRWKPMKLSVLVLPAMLIAVLLVYYGINFDFNSRQRGRVASLTFLMTFGLFVTAKSYKIHNNQLHRHHKLEDLYFIHCRIAEFIGWTPKMKPTPSAELMGLNASILFGGYHDMFPIISFSGFHTNRRFQLYWISNSTSVKILNTTLREHNETGLVITIPFQARAQGRVAITTNPYTARADKTNLFGFKRVIQIIDTDVTIWESQVQVLDEMVRPKFWTMLKELKAECEDTDISLLLDGQTMRLIIHDTEVFGFSGLGKNLYLAEKAQKLVFDYAKLLDMLDIIFSETEEAA